MDNKNHPYLPDFHSKNFSGIINKISSDWKIPREHAFSSFLTFLSACIGRSSYVSVGDVKIYPQMFFINIGDNESFRFLVAMNSWLSLQLFKTSLEYENSKDFLKGHFINFTRNDASVDVLYEDIENPLHKGFQGWFYSSHEEKEAEQHWHRFLMEKLPILPNIGLLADMSKDSFQKLANESPHLIEDSFCFYGEECFNEKNQFETFLDDDIRSLASCLVSLRSLFKRRGSKPLRFQLTKLARDNFFEVCGMKEIDERWALHHPRKFSENEKRTLLKIALLLQLFDYAHHSQEESEDLYEWMTIHSHQIDSALYVMDYFKEQQNFVKQFYAS